MLTLLVEMTAPPAAENELADSPTTKKHVLRYTGTSLLGIKCYDLLHIVNSTKCVSHEVPSSTHFSEFHAYFLYK